MLEWSKSYPLYILTLARPELADRRPGWGAGRRNFTSLSLEPLSPQAMDELLLLFALSGTRLALLRFEPFLFPQADGGTLG